MKRPQKITFMKAGANAPVDPPVDDMYTHTHTHTHIHILLNKKTGSEYISPVHTVFGRPFLTIPKNVIRCLPDINK